MPTMKRTLSLLFVIAALIWMAVPAVAQPCEWASEFHLPGTSGTVDALTVFDDGTGLAPYVGGSFRLVGDDVAANFIAKWDGTQWSPLGSGMDNAVRALTVFDDGTGPALYAGGWFTTAGGVKVNRIAKWDGTQWSPLGSGMNNAVWSLTVFDDGTGPALYAGGDFTTAGGVAANRIAKWDGTQWSPLGSGMGGVIPIVYALTAFDDGMGPALYAGGHFTMAGGVTVNFIAKWNGTQWSPLGSGMSGEFVTALKVFDDGTGPALYAGGLFNRAGDVAAGYIARWDGTQWSPVGSGMSERVFVLTAFDDGTGAALYAGGFFTMAGGVAANHIAKWNGTQWSPLGSGMSGSGRFSGVSALAVFDDGVGPALYAGGQFTAAGGMAAGGIARWDGTQWSPLGSGSGMSNTVRALTVFNDGTGPALYAGGQFTAAGSVAANFIARWDGTQWSPLGSGMGGPFPFVSALTVFNDGTDPALYAGGSFTMAGGVAVSRIAKWNGTQWSPLGSGLNERVVTLTVFDDGTGPALYAGGNFTMAGGVAASHIAKWDGTQWSPLGSGLNGDVFGLTVFNDGTDPALYAGGNFTMAGSVSANRIAKWDGTQWSPLGSGMNRPVVALTVFNDGTDPALYAGGNFTMAGSVSANRIAKWDGTQWSPLGNGMSGDGPFPIVGALTVFDDGTGPALYAGGDFTTAGGVAANYIAKWDGTQWSPLGSGVNWPVYDLTVFDDGTGPTLYAGGSFLAAGGRPSYFIAAWRCAMSDHVGTGVGSSSNPDVMNIGF